LIQPNPLLVCREIQGPWPERDRVHLNLLAPRWKSYPRDKSKKQHRKRAVRSRIAEANVQHEPFKNQQNGDLQNHNSKNMIKVTF